MRGVGRTPEERHCFKSGICVGAAGMLVLILALCFLASKLGAQPRGMQIEVRRCHPVDAPDDSDDNLVCSCKVADWIEDGEKRILVCEK